MTQHDIKGEAAALAEESESSDDDTKEVGEGGCTKGHEKRCRRSKTDPAECGCACDGFNHGLEYGALKKYAKHPRRSLSPDMGGELGDKIEDLIGETFYCGRNPDKPVEIGDAFVGYEHDGGWEDEDGTKWWAYYECPHCGKQWSIDKVAARVNIPVPDTAGGVEA